MNKKFWKEIAYECGYVLSAYITFLAFILSLIVSRESSSWFYWKSYLVGLVAVFFLLITHNLGKKF